MDTPSFIEEDSLVYSASDPKKKGKRESCLSMKKTQIVL